MKKKVGLLINCEACKDLITEQGALIFSPPTRDLVGKHHLCRKCYFILYDIWMNLDKYSK